MLTLLHRSTIEASPPIARLVEPLRQSRQNVVEPVVAIPGCFLKFGADALKEALCPLLCPKFRTRVRQDLLRSLVQWQGKVLFGHDEDFGERGTETIDGNVERAFDTEVYTTPEIERIARTAFELARVRRNKVCSVDKSNVLASGQLWRKVVTRVHAEEYSDVELIHLIVDNCSMQMIKNPKQFDILVMPNMFGDILSDCAGAISGTLGMLPSASLSAPDENGRRRALYEPIHGCAPDIAGQGKANPCGAILSVAMMFKYSFDREDYADLIHAAVADVLAAGLRTPDIAPAGMTPIGTVELGDAVVSALDRLS